MISRCSSGTAIIYTSYTPALYPLDRASSLWSPCDVPASRDVLAFLSAECHPLISVGVRLELARGKPQNAWLGCSSEYVQASLTLLRLTPKCSRGLVGTGTGTSTSWDFWSWEEQRGRKTTRENKNSPQSYPHSYIFQQNGSVQIQGEIPTGSCSSQTGRSHLIWSFAVLVST